MIDRLEAHEHSCTAYRHNIYRTSNRDVTELCFVIYLDFPANCNLCH